MDSESRKQDGIAIVVILIGLAILGVLGFIASRLTVSDIIIGEPVFRAVTTTPSDFVLPPPPTSTL